MMAGSNVMEDDMSVKIPCLGYEDECVLNRQTAFNKSLLQEHQKCGCFHCGSTFREADIKEWLKEEEGEDSALCPYCGVDAVIVGTRKFPLSTALLTSLFMRWFSEEYKERKNSATEAPPFSNHDDYLRKGVPFHFSRGEGEIVGEVDLWVDSVFDSMWNEEFDDDIPVSEEGLKSSQEGGIVSVKAYFDDDGCYVCEIRDNLRRSLPYEPWTGAQQDLLLGLTEKYGDELKGIIDSGGFGSKMRLFVNR